MTVNATGPLVMEHCALSSRFAVDVGVVDYASSYAVCLMSLVSEYMDLRV